MCTLITLVDIDYLDYIFEKIVSTKNKEFIFYILKNGAINSIISGTKYEKILEKRIKLILFLHFILNFCSIYIWREKYET